MHHDAVLAPELWDAAAIFGIREATRADTDEAI
jgi:hypothetical protein